MTEQEWLASDDPQAMLGYLQSPSDNANPNHIYPPSDRKLRLFACACVRQVWGLLVDDCSRKAVEVAERYGDGLASKEELDAAHKVSLREGKYPWQLGGGPDDARHAAKAAYRVSTPPGSEPAMAAEIVQGYKAAFSRSRPYQAALLRDIVGNLYRPVMLPPSPDRCKLCRGKGKVSAGPGGQMVGFLPLKCCGACSGRGFRSHPWIPPQVLSLAQAAYDERRQDGTLDPDRLAILADALEEAGCTEQAILTHLRSPGPHVRARLTILADALEEAGCTEQAILTHLRSPGPHVRGCWALDLVLGKE